jgi:uncharacterized protein YkwD
MRRDAFRVFLAVSIGAFACPATADLEAGYARRLAELVNKYRSSHGRPALTVDGAIAKLAQEHSAAMARAGQLNHDDFPSRVRRSGRPMCVENVGWNYRSPESQFEGWRASPGHDRNMLDPRVDRIGIGTAADYVTMIACGR